MKMRWSIAISACVLAATVAGTAFAADGTWNANSDGN